MNIEDLLQKIEIIENELQKTKNELLETKEKLKKYSWLFVRLTPQQKRFMPLDLSEENKIPLIKQSSMPLLRNLPIFPLKTQTSLPILNCVKKQISLIKLN